jgi:hypothetical protein
MTPTVRYLAVAAIHCDRSTVAAVLRQTFLQSSSGCTGIAYLFPSGPFFPPTAACLRK